MAELGFELRWFTSRANILNGLLALPQQSGILNVLYCLQGAMIFLVSRLYDKQLLMLETFSVHSLGLEKPFLLSFIFYLSSFSKLYEINLGLELNFCWSPKPALKPKTLWLTANNGLNIVIVLNWVFIHRKITWKKKSIPLSELIISLNKVLTFSSLRSKITFVVIV